MIYRIDSSSHYGYASKFGPGRLQNGQNGAGVENGQVVLVTCCGNCGDYSRVDVKDIPRTAEAVSKLPMPNMVDSEEDEEI